MTSEYTAAGREASSSRPGARPAASRSHRALRVIWYASVPIVALALATVFLIDATNIHGRDAIYPVAALIALAIIGLIGLFREIRAGLAAAPMNPELDEDEDPEGRRGDGVAWTRIAIAAAATVATYLVFLLLGYAVAVAVLSAIVAFVLGLRKPLWLAIFAISTAVACYLVFAVALESPLPAGLLLN